MYVGWTQTAPTTRPSLTRLASIKWRHIACRCLLLHAGVRKDLSQTHFVRQSSSDWRSAKVGAGNGEMHQLGATCSEMLVRWVSAAHQNIKEEITEKTPKKHVGCVTVFVLVKRVVVYCEKEAPTKRGRLLLLVFNEARPLH